VDRAFVESPLV